MENQLAMRDVKNIDSILNHKNTNQTLMLINQLLQIDQKELGKSSKGFSDLNLKSFNALVDTLYRGYFSLEDTDKESEFKRLAIYLNTVLIEHIKFNLSPDITPANILVLTKLVLDHCRFLDDFRVIDQRFNIVSAFLINSYKIILFHDKFKITMAEFDKLEKALTSSESNHHSCVASLAIKFTELLTSLIFSFDVFKDFNSTTSIKIELFRKFNNNFFKLYQEVLTRCNTHLSFRTLVDVLNSFHQMKRNSEKLMNENLSTQQVFSNASNKILLGSKFVQTEFPSFLSAKINQKLNDELESVLSKIPVDKFSFEHIFSTEFHAYTQMIQDLGGINSVKILKSMLFKMSEALLVAVERESKTLTMSKIQTLIHAQIEFIENNMPDFSFANFTKFFDFYLDFLKTRRLKKCETDLAMMSVILGDELSLSCIRAVIRTKDYTKVSFTSAQIEEYITNSLECQRQGDSNIQKSCARRAQVSLFFSIIKNSLKMRSILRDFKPKNGKSTKSIDITESKLEHDLKMRLMTKHSITAVFLNFSRDEFKNMNSETLTHIENHFLDQNSKRYSYSMLYDNLKIALKTTNKRTMRVLLPGQIRKIKIAELVRKKVVLIEYKNDEQLVIYQRNFDALNSIFHTLDTIVSLFKKLRPNTKL